MFLTIFLSGMLVSMLLDLFYFSCVKKGIQIESYPTEYLRYTKYQLFRAWVIWAALWPLVLVVSVCTAGFKRLKK